MTKQFSTRVRNAMLDAIETTMGTGPIMRIRSGAPPANTGAARTGSILATINLPSDWMNAASSGSKTLLGSWADANGVDIAGTAGHYEIEGTGATIDEQGTVTNTGGGGDMTVDNTNMAVGQPFSVTSFTYNAGNA